MRGTQDGGARVLDLAGVRPPAATRAVGHPEKQAGGEICGLLAQSDQTSPFASSAKGPRPGEQRVMPSTWVCVLALLLPPTSPCLCQLSLWVSVVLSVKWDVKGLVLPVLALLPRTGKGL